MKQILFGIVVVAFLINGLLTDEINVHLSSKDSKIIGLFLGRLFPVNDAGSDIRPDINIKADKQINTEDFPSRGSSVACNTCQDTVFFFPMNRSLPLTVFQKVLIGTCDILKPVYKASCINFYKTNGLKAIKDIVKRVHPSIICKDLNFCQESKVTLKSEDILANVLFLFINVTITERNCRNCQTQTNFLERVIDSSKSATFVIQKLSSACSLYNTNDKNTCNNSYYNDYVLHYVKSILTHVPPLKMCQDMRICPKKEDNSQSKEKVISLKNHTSLSCNMCLSIVKSYEVAFNHSKSVSAVQKVFIGSCDILKPLIRSQCIIFYKTSGLQAIKDILKGVAPQKVCENLRFCRKKMEDSFLEDSLPDNHLLLTNIYTDDSACKNCQKIIKFYERVIDSTKSVSFVVLKLSAVCSIYQTKYQSSCSNYFKNPAVRQFVKSILEHKCPFKMCKEAGVCRQKEVVLKLPDATQTKLSQNSLSPCILCNQVAYIWDRLTVNKRTMANMIAVSNMVCNYVPTVYRAQCLDFVTKHKYDVGHHLLAGTNSDIWCRKMSICEVAEDLRGSLSHEISSEDTAFFLPRTNIL